MGRGSRWLLYQTNALVVGVFGEVLERGELLVLQQGLRHVRHLA